MIDVEEMMIWCKDDQRHQLSIFMVDDGKSVCLVPKHRANAMADAGRFVTKKFNDIGTTRSCNQDVKDSNGVNYFVGDIVFKVSRGGPIPDPSVFGEDPIKFILNPKIPNAEMECLYGTEMAKHMLNPRMQYSIPCDQTISLSKYRQSLQWSLVTYHMMPRECNNTQFKALMRTWGWGD